MARKPARRCLIRLYPQPKKKPRSLRGRRGGKSISMTTIYTKRRPRRNSRPRIQNIETRTSSITSDTASQFTVGGLLVHRRTRRCVAFCNMVAALAGVGQVEAR
jgi:hypothetical protein